MHTNSFYGKTGIVFGISSFTGFLISSFLDNLLNFSFVFEKIYVPFISILVILIFISGYRILNPDNKQTLLFITGHFISILCMLIGFLWITGNIKESIYYGYYAVFLTGFCFIGYLIIDKVVETRKIHLLNKEKNL